MKKLILILMIAVVGTGCHSIKSNEGVGAKLGTLLDFRSLTRKDYIVRASVKGEATVVQTRVLVWSWYNWGNMFASANERAEIKGYPNALITTNALDSAREHAVYNALESVPDADLILQPRFYYECNSVQYVVYAQEICKVIVRGKAISIRED